MCVYMHTTLHISSNKNERFLPIMTYLLLLCCTVSHLGWRAINPHSRCTCPPSSLPQEVWSSRWEVMEQCGSVGGDMTSCQALMQANIWRLLATSLLACRQGPLAWSQKTPWGTYTKGQTRPLRQEAAAMMVYVQQESLWLLSWNESKKAKLVLRVY